MVHDPDVPPNRCFPGKEEVARLVADITGKKMAALENMLAAIRCSRVEGRVADKHRYLGHRTCTAAHLAFGGPSACRYACVGYGECAHACPFDAITMADGLPVVDPKVCVGCGTCVRTCPKKIIELIPANARVWVPCRSRDTGKTVKEICGVGCISCKKCVKVCPAQAVRFEDGVVHIDHLKCVEYGSGCGELCVEKCPRGIFRAYKPSEATSVRFETAA